MKVGMMKSRFAVVLLCSVYAVLAYAGSDTTMLPLPNSGNVTLTLDEYNRLVEMAAKPPKNPDVAPLPYSIKHADVKLRVENDGVRGSVQLEGEVFRKGVSKVPLTTGMTILDAHQLDAHQIDAHQGGKDLPLEQENGTHSALLPGPGEFSVDLETGLPLRIEAGRASFSLPVPAAGSVQLTLVIPGDHTWANISPGLITGRKSENGHTAIEATLVPGQSASIWWATREAVTPVVPREVRFLADAKTLVSVSEAEMRVAVLADLTVVQGEPRKFEVAVPEGYEITGVTGASLDSTETHSGVLTLKVSAPGQRSHQFLISMERSINASKADAPFLSFKGAQRETGEVLVEGAGTMEITATEGGGLKRMDVKEASPYLRALAHFPPQAAFRYHKQSDETPTLALGWVRFPDSSVLAAVAESAVVTTLVTSEGKSLTEVKLTLKNQAQPFLKVALPAGATILSAEVGGEPVKPVQGSDGSRVPLLRPRFHPTDSYTVSFVFMHSGAPFAKKGGAELSLPNMDIPISLLNWEVFLPEQYKVKDFGGDVIAADRVPPAFSEEAAMRDYRMREAEVSSSLSNNMRLESYPGQMGGYVVDPSGAVVPNARVTVTSTDNGSARTVITDAQGHWVAAAMQSGNFKARVEMPGFGTSVFNLNYDSSQPSAYNFPINVASVAETVEVSAAAPQLQTEAAAIGGFIGGPIHGKQMNSLPLVARNVTDLAMLGPGVAAQQNGASANVVNLQKRVAGVLPVPIDVPRAGTSFSFVRPLVLDEETKVTFSYKSR
ncbi:MAG TPA: carboxypeptidase-like regulatory domain-containing protein [Candidatus Sulfotelmatobacter sp.]|nr:carboxypeptidase-like regulatory domain-containing protein [Candidatus Sulfotelmatobacter sp.]